MTAKTLWRTTVRLTAVAFLCLLTSVPAAAQVSTSTIQGTVSDATGVLPGATVTAREVSSGFTQETVSGSDGAFALAGLRPGHYEITVAVSQYKPQAKTVEILVGQNVTVDFVISPDVGYTETVQVVSEERLTDMRTTEVSTNVTEEQIQHLPQNSRNFLNFAALAPGLRVSDNELRKEFSPPARCPRRTSTCSSTASASRTTSSMAVWSARTPAGAIRSRRMPCASSRS